LASGDAGGSLLVWTLFDDEQRTEEKMEIDGAENAIEDPEKKRGDPEMDIPPNKENWVRTFRASMAHHDSEITALCFSPDSQLVASVSMAYSVAVNRADNGIRIWENCHFKF
jgi:WD40 repeat protein